jgi:hypothetical protein
MLRNQLLLVLGYLLMTCSSKEEPINMNNAFGLYKRERQNSIEYLCLGRDQNYTFYSVENGERKSHLTAKWNLDIVDQESRIGLNNFENIGISSPILYSHAKKVVVIRMDVDDSSQDFIKIDNACSNQN